MIAHEGTFRVAGGSAGQCLSARSSVPIDLCLLCNTAAITLQEFPTNGKHSGVERAVSDVCSAVSGLFPKLKTIPTVSGMQVSHRAESSLCAASTCAINAQTRRARSPCAALCLPLNQGQGFL